MITEFKQRVQEYIFNCANPAPSIIVAVTSIPECNFYGLFANSFFQKGSVICVYTGTRLITKDALKLKDKSYLMRLGEQCYVDAKFHTQVYARFINDCINPMGWNCTFVKDPENWLAWVVATRDIMPGEEIYVDYGRWYWLAGPKPVRKQPLH